LILQVEWQEGHPAHKNPVVVPVSLSSVRAPAHQGVPGAPAHSGVPGTPAHQGVLGSKGRKRVVVVFCSVETVESPSDHMDDDSPK